MHPDVTPLEIKFTALGFAYLYHARTLMLFYVLPSIFPYGFSSKRETAHSLQISYEGQNTTEFTANMLLTCILYCDARPGCNYNCLQVQ